MRVTPRKPRGFRPLADALEALAPVSTLVPGLPADTPAATADRAEHGGKNTQAGATQMGGAITTAIQKASSVSVASVRTLAPAVIGGAGGDRGSAGPAPNDSSTPTTAASRPSDQADSLFDKATEFATPLAPPSAGSVAAAGRTAAQPQSNGGPAVANPAPASTRPASPSPAPVVAAAGSAGASTGAGAIRPMSLAPSQPILGASTVQGLQSLASGGGNAGAGARRGAGIGHGLRPDAASGSGSVPPPIISGLGSGSVKGPDLPVGADATFDVLSPPGWTIDPSSINWSGGTDYKSYFTDAASTTVKQDSSLVQQQVTTGVDTRSSVYSFILGAEQKQYTVTINCAYRDPNDGEDIEAPPTTVTFNAIRPTVASISGAGGFYAFYTGNGLATLGYSDNNQPWTNGLGLGNVMTAVTQTGEFGGNFMFLQLINFDHAYTDDTGASFNLSTVGNGPDLDDGFLETYNPIGSELDAPANWAGQNGWFLGPESTSTTTKTHDSPSNSKDIDYEYLSADDTFHTYLMYQPAASMYLPAGVWVALAELTWSWSGSATNTGTPGNPHWPENSATTASGGTVSTPSGSSAFPSWDGDASEATWDPGL
jgi:hypothetical protein